MVTNVASVSTAQREADFTAYGRVPESFRSIEIPAPGHFANTPNTFEMKELSMPADSQAHSIREMVILGSLQTALNLIIFILAAASAAAFVSGQTAWGFGTLGPALGGLVGVIGIQWRILRRCR